MIKPIRSASIVLLSCVAVFLFGCSSEQKTDPDENVVPEPITQETVSETAQPQQATADAVDSQPSEAENKLTFARHNLKMAQQGILGYHQVVAICRGVMRDYPGTDYVQQAQDILRQIPEDKRGQYKLTNAELGIE